jgi:hypothetical protein
VAIDPSGEQVLLVSPIPIATHLRARRFNVIFFVFFCFFSLTTDMNPVSQNPRVPAAEPCGSDDESVPGVSVLDLLLALYQSPFVSSQWLLWRKVTNGKCGSSFVLSTIRGQFNFK